MNQILVTEKVEQDNKKNKNFIEKLEISSIIKYFAIALIIFGIALTGNASYALSQGIKQKKEEKVPIVTIEKKGNLLKVNVKSEVPIRSFGYSWNNDELQYTSGANKTEFKIEIKIIQGNDNKLNISILDTNNKKTKYTEKYSQEADTTEPDISITNEDPKIKITVTDDTELDHVIYKYGDNDEVTVKADSSDPTKIEIYIDDVQSTQQTLTVEAVDVAQNHAEESQEVKGTTKPKIDIRRDINDASLLHIIVTDEDNLRMIVFYINDKQYQTDPNVSLDKKTFDQKLRVSEGTTKIRVNAYNVSGQTSEVSVDYTY